MDVFKTLSSLKAELVCNRAIVHTGGRRVVAARVIDGVMTVTPEGEQLLADKPKPKTEAKSRAKPKPKDGDEGGLGAAAARTRARNPDGTLRGDDPTTPDVNEAWTDGDD